ncbi:MAG: DUF4340 domain-containing protein [Vicinamibacterales bacterium]
MRGLRSTLVLLVVLVGLGAYIYFAVPQEENAVSQENRVFPGLETAVIDRVVVQSESGDATTVEKNGDDWQIVSPLTARASTIELGGIASALTTLDRERTVEEASANLSEFGLEPPRARVEFSTQGDTLSGELLIGNKTSTGQSLYAKRADAAPVFLIPSYHEGSLNRSTFDLRDKNLLAIDRAEVQSLTVNNAGSAISFEKEGTDWRLASPLTGRADAAMVDGLIGSVAGAQMRSVAAENASPEELRKYGVEKSDLTVSFNNNGTVTGVQLGAPVDENTLYARNSAGGLVVVIDKSIADMVRRPAEEYRRRELFGFRSFTASHIEFTRNSQTIVFERPTSSDGNTPAPWRRTAPTAGDVDASQIESLLNDVANMRVTSFVASTANTGLDAPVLTVTATYDNGANKETVTFGRQGQNVYASRADESGALQVSASALDEALKALDGLSQ